MDPFLLSILVLLLFIAGTLLVNGGVLSLILRLFKVPASSYFKAVAIFGICAVLAVLATFVFSYIYAPFLSIISTFFIFFYLVHRYYGVRWLKALILYITFGIVGLIVSAVLYNVIPSSLPIQLFVIQGDSMLPAYGTNDYVLIDARDGELSRSDVVVFHAAEDPDYVYIARIIGLPSEQVEIKNGDVYINSSVLDESAYWGDEAITHRNTSVTLGPGEYFVLGDNRGIASDSRDYGPLPQENILGRVFYLFD